jgi:UDP-N-acetylglucosamine acyltransferase
VEAHLSAAIYFRVIPSPPFAHEARRVSTSIHPSAIIESGALIGDDCTVGPYCVIGPHVRLGPRCTLHSHVIVDGNTTIGQECELFPCACIGKKTQDLKFTGGSPGVRIGSRTVLREYVTVHAATSDGDTTDVGDGCLIQAYCHIAHDCKLGNGVIMSSGAKMSGHVQVGDHAGISGMTGIVQFVRIGALAFVGGFSKLAQDALPYCITDGIPAATVAVNKVGMERNGRSQEAIAAVGEAHKAIMRSAMTLQDALAELSSRFPQSPEVADIIAFCRSCERGLARPRDR